MIDHRMRDDTKSATVLVGVDLSDPSFLARPLLRQLAAFRVVLLGWEEVPIQTSLEQAQLELAEKSQSALDSLSASFEEVGATVQSRFVFTHNRFETIERICAEEECDAVLVPRPTTEITRILLPLRGFANMNRVGRVTGTLVRQEKLPMGQELTVTLLHVAEEKREPGTEKVGFFGMGTSHLARRGVDVNRIDFCSPSDRSPVDAVARKACHDDLLVIGESTPSISGAFLGTRSERIVQKTAPPVLVVKHDKNACRKSPATRIVGGQR